MNTYNYISQLVPDKAAISVSVGHFIKLYLTRLPSMLYYLHIRKLYWQTIYHDTCYMLVEFQIVSKELTNSFLRLA